MRWTRRTASAVWMANWVVKSRAEVMSDLGVVNFAVAISRNRAHAGGMTNRAVAFSLHQPGSMTATWAEYARSAAEPCSLLLLGTGAVGFALLVLRAQFRIKPEALIEAQSSPVALPEAVART